MGVPIGLPHSVFVLPLASLIRISKELLVISPSPADHQLPIDPFKRTLFDLTGIWNGLYLGTLNTTLRSFHTP